MSIAKKVILSISCDGNRNGHGRSAPGFIDPLMLTGDSDPDNDSYSESESEDNDTRLSAARHSQLKRIPADTTATQAVNGHDRSQPDTKQLNSRYSPSTADRSRVIAPFSPDSENVPLAQRVQQNAAASECATTDSSDDEMGIMPRKRLKQIQISRAVGAIPTKASQLKRPWSLDTVTGTLPMPRPLKQQKTESTTAISLVLSPPSPQGVISPTLSAISSTSSSSSSSSASLPPHARQSAPAAPNSNKSSKLVFEPFAIPPRASSSMPNCTVESMLPGPTLAVARVRPQQSSFPGPPPAPLMVPVEELRNIECFCDVFARAYQSTNAVDAQLLLQQFDEACSRPSSLPPVQRDTAWHDVLTSCLSVNDCRAAVAKATRPALLIITHELLSQNLTITTMNDAQRQSVRFVHHMCGLLAYHARTLRGTASFGVFKQEICKFLGRIKAAFPMSDKPAPWQSLYHILEQLATVWQSAPKDKENPAASPKVATNKTATTSASALPVAQPTAASAAAPALATNPASQPLTSSDAASAGPITSSLPKRTEPKRIDMTHMSINQFKAKARGYSDAKSCTPIAHQGAPRAEVAGSTHSVDSNVSSLSSSTASPASSLASSHHSPTTSASPSLDTHEKPATTVTSLGSPPSSGATNGQSRKSNLKHQPGFPNKNRGHAIVKQVQFRLEPQEFKPEAPSNELARAKQDDLRAEVQMRLAWQTMKQDREEDEMQPATAASTSVSATTPPSVGWKCANPTCRKKNEARIVCYNCGRPRTVNGRAEVPFATAIIPPAAYAPPSSSFNWRCVACRQENEDTRLTCVCCAKQRSKTPTAPPVVYPLITTSNANANAAGSPSAAASSRRIVAVGQGLLSAPTFTPGASTATSPGAGPAPTAGVNAPTTLSSGSSGARHTPAVAFMPVDPTAQPVRPQLTLDQAIADCTLFTERPAATVAAGAASPNTPPAAADAMPPLKSVDETSTVKPDVAALPSASSASFSSSSSPKRREAREMLSRERLEREKRKHAAATAGASATDSISGSDVSDVQLHQPSVTVEFAQNCDPISVAPADTYQPSLPEPSPQPPTSAIPESKAVAAVGDVSPSSPFPSLSIPPSLSMIVMDVASDVLSAPTAGSASGSSTPLADVTSLPLSFPPMPIDAAAAKREKKRRDALLREARVRARKAEREAGAATGAEAPSQPQEASNFPASASTPMPSAAPSASDADSRLADEQAHAERLH